MCRVGVGSFRLSFWKEAVRWGRGHVVGVGWSQHGRVSVLAACLESWQWFSWMKNGSGALFLPRVLFGLAWVYLPTISFLFFFFLEGGRYDEVRTAILIKDASRWLIPGKVSPSHFCGVTFETPSSLEWVFARNLFPMFCKIASRQVFCNDENLCTNTPHTLLHYDAVGWAPIDDLGVGLPWPSTGTELMALVLSKLDVIVMGGELHRKGGRFPYFPQARRGLHL